MEALDCDGILFDCDGVLVDSFEPAAIAWDAWAAEWAPRFDFRTQVVHGVRSIDLIAGLVDPGRLEEAAAALNTAELRTVAGTPGIEGAAALTAALGAIPWAVVTSGVRPLAEARLAAAGIAAPRALITGDDVAKGKPHPEPYLRGAAAIGLAPARCAVFEDAPAGIEAARAAGAGLVVGVGAAAAVGAPDLLVEDLSAVGLDGLGRLVIAPLIPRQA